MRIEFTGTILNVRAVEDSIRATKKYTKGAFTRAARHPIQGEDFPSKVLTEYYEVYPDMEIGWDMHASDALTWLWGETPHIDVRFHYNYQSNQGSAVILGNNGVVDMLKEGIPDFIETLAALQIKGNNGKQVIR